MTYAVIDTNVIVASLLTRSHDSATARVMNAVYAGQVVPLVCDEILAEYDEVLHRARLKLDPAKCDYILIYAPYLQALPWAIWWRIMLNFRVIS